MSVLASTVPTDTTQEGFRLSRMTPAEKLGLLMIVPYIILFLVFVVYPVGYGLWLARSPAPLRRARQRSDFPAHRHQHLRSFLVRRRSPSR
jgi:ABC-type sugar transport system permease subunit